VCEGSDVECEGMIWHWVTVLKSQISVFPRGEDLKERLEERHLHRTHLCLKVSFGDSVELSAVLGHCWFFKILKHRHNSRSYLGYNDGPRAAGHRENDV
jgi:hypothetical protein